METEVRKPLAEENLGLVHLCANRFRGRGIEYDDLYSAGCIGLLKAVKAFDSSRGVKFSTYAVPVILGEIKRLFRDGGAVRVSRSLKELSMRLSRICEDFRQREMREPTVAELSQLSGETESAVAEALCVSQPTVSLTAGDDDEGQTDIPTESPDESITDLLALRQIMARLPHEDRALLELRYFRGLTQTKTAKALGMTQVQVSRREKKLLTQMREELLS
ncbi:sigma-70 family RNA polymerase sigma factor [Ruminococcus flavefaciens]|uniref:RNA polymerase sporulation-specific sigma factor n=1 Tax=Ruminococcus flavefaciens TaxID=1265 RepID=A0A315XXS9_RUMFL|nr:sigma-70 family RNA polymerase sigma factor [Ruminococcus flavefaciens]PWJ12302.1 RNA polymerase sporulation-specific sigma factor [Ruminococcus flavefaciens]SSA49792.1 RNA polymerase sporulation-specific sigma factor [Ruminococcus flavefaciens]